MAKQTTQPPAQDAPVQDTHAGRRTGTGNETPAGERVGSAVAGTGDAYEGTLSQRGPGERHEGRAGAARAGSIGPYAGYANPFEIVQRMSEEVDRMFESFGFGPGLFGRSRGARALAPLGDFAPFGMGSFGGAQPFAPSWTPRIEVTERDGRMVVEADLPGVRREDLSVQVDEDAIVIEGERRQERGTDERGYYHSERRYGAFRRTIALPEGADADNARARFRDGVLEVEVPMASRARGRRLEIQDASVGGAEQGRTLEGRATSGGGTRSAGGSSGGSAGSL